jgi:hypothetical protein
MKKIELQITLAVVLSIFIIFQKDIKAQGWSYVGNSGISTLNPTASQSKIFYDANGVIHVGYINGTNASTVTILKFDSTGNIWTTVSQHTLNRVAVETDYAIASNGDIYFAYQASFVSQRIYRVKKFSNGNWTFMGDSIVSFNTTKVDLEIANSEIYLMANRNVHKWDNTGSSWQNIHSVPSGSQFVNGVLALDNNQNIHILNCNNLTLTTTYYLKLEKYDGTSWTDVGDTLHVPNALHMHLMFNNSNEPVTAFSTSAGLTPNHNIIQWNGTSWQNVGNLSSTPNVLVFSATLNAQGNPMFTSADYGGIVYEFDGTSYIALDSATVSFPLLQINDLSVNPINGKKHILITELNANASGSVHSVMEYMGTTPAIPAQPTNLTATPVNSIELNWQDNSNNEDGFYIESTQDTIAGSWTQIATVGADVTTYLHTGLTIGVTYYYRVSAFNGNGSSSWSNIAGATDGATGLAGVDIFNSISIFPNPSSYLVNIGNIPNNSTVRIMDMTGKLVYSSTVVDTQTTISTLEFLNGIYLIQLENNGNISNKKLIVNH